MNIIKIMNKVLGLDSIYKIAQEEFKQLCAEHNFKLHLLTEEGMFFACVHTQEHYVSYFFDKQVTNLTHKSNIVYINPSMIKVGAIMFGYTRKTQLRTMIRAILLHELGHVYQMTNEDHKQMLLQEINKDKFGVLLNMSAAISKVIEPDADMFCYLHGTDEEATVLRTLACPDYKKALQIRMNMI